MLRSIILLILSIVAPTTFANARGVSLNLVDNTMLTTGCTLTTKAGAIDNRICEIDTGAVQSILWRSPIAMRLPKTELHTLNIGLPYHWVKTTDSIKFSSGPLVWRTNEVIIFDRGSKFDQLGLIGMDGLGHGTVAFDFQQMKLESLLSIPADVRKHSFSRGDSNDGRIYLNGVVARKPVRVIWDTGGGALGLVNVNFLRENYHLFTFVRKLQLSSLSGPRDTEDTAIYRLNVPITINEVEVSNLEFISTDFANGAYKAHGSTDITFLIGYPAMRDRVWYFDFTNNKWGTRN